jgi:fluoroquinolone transport system ATP-binding protein
MTVADDLCDRVAFMVDGSLALIDAPRTLKLQYGKRIVRVEVQTAVGPAQHEFALAGLGENQTFLDLIRTHPVETLHTQEATLEDIFIQVTGRRLQ